MTIYSLPASVCTSISHLRGVRWWLALAGNLGSLADRNTETERDSTKDQAVVFIFIFATVGLLIYAIVRPWMSKWVDVS